MGKQFPKSIVYIDGFNLYYRLLSKTRCKWLNLDRYFSIIRTSEEIVAIKYFTSPVKGRPERSAGRQKTYIDALKTTPRVRVIMGGFASQPVDCRVRECAHAERKYRILQEKKTDVALGIHMVSDAMRGDIDRVILVSGDSDMIPALRMIKSESPGITTTVYVPSFDGSTEPCVEIRRAADKDRNLPAELLSRALFPDEIALPGGGKIKKPRGW